MTGSDAVVGGGGGQQVPASKPSVAVLLQVDHWARAPGPGFQVEFETRFAAQAQKP